MKLETDFFKGPVTSCEYFKENYILLGYGPYLSLINDTTNEEITKCLALKYRTIHKVIKCTFNQDLFCVFGQKAFKLMELSNEELIAKSNEIELEDWIFDIYWLNSTYLIIVCAHNQCILYNLIDNKLEQIVYCDQKCMLYSAKILDMNPNSNQLENKIIISGTIYNQILLWNAQNGQILDILNDHQGVIFNIDYSYETNTIFSVSDDRSINVWKLVINNNQINQNETKLITRFYGHDARVWKCASFISNNIEYLCSIGEDLNCCLWNINSQSLVYRFNAIKKGSKNIWSLCINVDKLCVYTGWADGSVRRFELKNYITKQTNYEIDNIQTDQFEFNIKNENDKDYIRNILLLNDKIVCCTHLGYLYLIDSNLNENKTAVKQKNPNQKLILHHMDLASYNIMVSIKIDSNKWIIAVGTIKGSIYLLDINLSKDFNNNQIKIDSFDNLADLAIKSNGNSFKICNLIWHQFDNRQFLISCYSFLNGLIHLYELIDGKLELQYCLHLPESKHRWLTSYIIIQNNYLIGGDKCGNLYLYHLNSDKLTEPIQSFKSLTKQNASISALYCKPIDECSYLIICCCKDGWYRLFDLIFTENEPTFKLINKYQINSFIDIIETFIFDHNLADFNLASQSEETFENSLTLATCFYGDKFLLWNFQLNRALFEFRCGGANRSWDYAIYNADDDNILFRFVSISNKKVCETSKLISKSEIRKPSIQTNNHFFQLFHGNTITTCKFFKKYLLTGSEDTQLIVTKLDNVINHEYHLQGHDSVVKCISFSQINENETLLVSAGGKANIKIWKIIHYEEEIKKIVHLYEFKRVRPKKDQDGAKIKPWLYTDLKSNPDIRFMDMEVFKTGINFTICFVCSDGLIRLFNYNLETNKLNLTNKFIYDKCLLNIKYLTIKSNNYLLTCGTDGHLVQWKLNTNEDISIERTFKSLHQSGINGIDLWQEEDQVLTASVGDDTCLTVCDLNNDLIVKKQMAHASSIASVKFLTKNFVITVSKDQRLAVWNYDQENGLITLSKQMFINVADVSSMDVLKTKTNCFKIAIAGVGFEIINLTLD